MLKDKRNVILEYQEFCKKEHLAESPSTASFWCETHLKKDTKINQQRIAEILKYIEKENPDAS